MKDHELGRIFEHLEGFHPICFGFETLRFDFQHQAITRHNLTRIENVLGDTTACMYSCHHKARACNNARLGYRRICTEYECLESNPE